MGRVALVNIQRAEDRPKEDIETGTIVVATGSVAIDDVLGGLKWRSRYTLDLFLSSNSPP